MSKDSLTSVSIAFFSASLLGFFYNITKTFIISEENIIIIRINEFLVRNMDEIDLILIRKLRENSRLTYRELSEITNMTVSGIHKRVKNLVDNEDILAFIARPSVLALKFLWVAIWGTSNARSMDAVSKELGQHENIYVIAIAGGKYLIIPAYIRNISELQDFSSYVSRTGQISEPTIGIINVPYVTTPEPLTTIDYKILKALNRDSRKPITDIADDVGISAKTVKRRLDRMIENKLARFTIEWAPLSENNFNTVFHINLKEGTDINSTIQYLNQKHSQNTAYCQSYSNIPNFLSMHVWTKSSKGTQKIQEDLQTEGFKDVIPHIYLSAKYYDCWVDQLLRTKS